MLKRWMWVVVPVVVVGLAVGLWAFQPWRLFTSSTVDEAAPAGATGGAVLASGTFEDGSKTTTGRAVVLELDDGSRVLRLEDMAGSDGPDVHVWITDQPSGGDHGSYDDGRYVRLGNLKATHGNQNYEIPDDADLAGLRSVVIWCDRFNTAFGTAPVQL